MAEPLANIQQVDQEHQLLVANRMLIEANQKLIEANQRLVAAARKRRLPDYGAPQKRPCVRDGGPFMVWAFDQPTASSLAELAQTHQEEMRPVSENAAPFRALCCYSVHIPATMFARLVDPLGHSPQHLAEVLNHPGQRKSYKKIFARYLVRPPPPVELSPISPALAMLANVSVVQAAHGP
jgi:hypothetical protein